MWLDGKAKLYIVLYKKERRTKRNKENRNNQFRYIESIYGIYIPKLTVFIFFDPSFFFYNTIYNFTLLPSHIRIFNYCFWNKLLGKPLKKNVPHG